MTFAGFPRSVRFTPVPNPLFAQLLEQIDDLAELKCTLRVIWLLHQKKGFPRFVALGELLADRTLINALTHRGKDTSTEVRSALARAVQRGTLATTTVRSEEAEKHLYALNTETNRRALEDVQDGSSMDDSSQSAEPWEGAVERPNIFSLYEDNIGMLSPIIAEELKEAEEEYPQSWIEEAFREAVSLNKRSWRYIARILERWQQEGRSDGGPFRYPKEAGYREYFRR